MEILQDIFRAEREIESNVTTSHIKAKANILARLKRVDFQELSYHLQNRKVNSLYLDCQEL